jgi:hypothetical protein|nr:MAG TPA: hypothetical protein [Caudoviricetes sp.]
MILVILILGILMTIGGTILYCKLDGDKDVIGTSLQITGAAVITISTIAAIILLISVIIRVGIDKKITMYEEENTKIEQQIADVVTQYQEYEAGIFTEVAPENAMTLVALYPELKSDILVQSQIKVYVDNNKQIKELKSMAINASILRWWLYFGK